MDFRVWPELALSGQYANGRKAATPDVLVTQAVLPSTANLGHTAQWKTAPEGAVVDTYK